MELAVILNAHQNNNLLLDTINSIKKYLTKKILVVVDGVYWKDFENLNEFKIRGMNHACNKAPYKNVALGLSSLYQLYPNCEWYCYIEPDCLVTSSDIINILEKASERNIWLMGNDGRISPHINIEFASNFIDMPIYKQHYYYLLGCCQFFNKSFLRNLVDRNFFEKFLVFTNEFHKGFFPYYKGYDISEHLYPTIARALGGKIGVFASWDFYKNEWHGNYEKFPMRWAPQLSMNDNFESVCILHPIKNYDDPIRIFHRNRRWNGDIVRNNY